MFVISTEYTANAVGRRLHLRLCSKCGCEFGYEALRIGMGRGTSYYFLNNEGAENRATRRAEAAAARLAEESPEVVPCPRCDHIEEDMIDEWGRGSALGWFFLGSLGVILGLIVLLIASMLSYYPPKKWPPSSSTLLVFAGIGVGMFIAGAIVLLIRHRSLSSSRPIPSPTTRETLLDLGYNPALVLQAGGESGFQLVPAKPVMRRVEAGSFVVSVLKSSPEAICPVCLAPLADPSLLFCRCRACMIPMWSKRLALIAVAILLVWGVIGWRSPGDGSRYLGGALIGGAVGLVVGGKLFPRLAASRLDRLRGVWRVWSRHEQYLQSLQRHFQNEVSYAVPVTGELVDELREEARARSLEPKPSLWARRYRRIIKMMNTEVTTG